MSKANKAYKFRIYPNKEQKEIFAKTFGCVRFIYNKMLADRIMHYKATGKRLENTPAQYKAQFPWLKEVDSLALANAQLHLNAAYNAFFSNPKIGFPRFKSKRRSREAYSTNNQKGSVRIEGGRIKLPKIGFVKIRQHRAVPEEWKIKTVTVSKTSTDKYFVSVLLEYENQVCQKDVSELAKFEGLDFSMHDLFVTSKGEIPGYPRFYRQTQERLAKAQRKLSHCVKGSNNRNRQRLKVARLHERCANQRADFLHKLALHLAEEFDVICIEDLDMKGMSQALRFGKSVSDNSWGFFTRILGYKLSERGKKLVKAEKNFASSQTCHCCGYRNPETKNLSVREWTCPNCGTHHDRDTNAAINLREKGKQITLLA